MTRADLTPAAVQAALDSRREQQEIVEQAAAYSETFRQFVAAAWPVIEPATPFDSNWHIDAIAEHLQAVSRREMTAF